MQKMCALQALGMVFREWGQGVVRKQTWEWDRIGLLDTCLTSSGLQSHCSRFPPICPLSCFLYFLTPSSKTTWQVLVLAARQSLTQTSSHRVGSRSPERKFFFFIFPSQYDFNTFLPSFLFWCLSLTLSWALWEPSYYNRPNLFSSISSKKSQCTIQFFLALFFFSIFSLLI